MIVGVGVDLVDIARVRRLIASKGERALRRLFTELECDYAMSHALPFVHLAARVAAKEAAFKALSGTDGARAIGWREMEVRTLEHGRPSLTLHGMAERRAKELGVTSVWLSLSHSDLTAGAVVVLEAEQRQA
jgi:holo-[acyl-carrier protein] synthase